MATTGADQPQDAEFEDIVTAAPEAGPAEAEDSHAMPPPEPEDDGEVPAPLPGMPDMTPVGGGLARAAAATPVKGPSAKPSAAADAPLAFSPLAGQTRKAKSRPERSWAGGFLDFALLVALAPGAMWLVSALGTKFELWSQQQGFDAMLIQGPTESLGWVPAIALVSVLTGLIGLLVAVFGGFSKLWGRALLALLVTSLTWAAIIAFGVLDARTAPVHDVSTDWNDPLTFSSAILRARGPDANPVDPSPILPLGSRAFAGRRLADVNAETCPAARPVTVAMPAAQAFVDARAALESAGLSIVTADAASGRIEATAVSLLYGFKDDVVVRVRPDGAGSRIDLRAVRRNGATDMGANCRRIESLTTAMAG